MIKIKQNTTTMNSNARRKITSETEDVPGNEATWGHETPKTNTHNIILDLPTVHIASIYRRKTRA
jgi:hypothetical protein